MSFRIDHDEIFNSTLHFEYQWPRRGPWFAFELGYDSALVSGAVPCCAPTATCFASTPVADGRRGDDPERDGCLE